MRPLGWVLTVSVPDNDPVRFMYPWDMRDEVERFAQVCRSQGWGATIERESPPKEG